MIHAHTGILVLIFFAFSLFVGSLTRNLLKTTTIPYTVALLVIGLMVGVLGQVNYIQQTHYNLYEGIRLISEIDPKLVLFIFLPILIFESAFSLDVHLFRKLILQIIILAVPCLIVCIIFTAFIIEYLFPFSWGLIISLMFAALISATDPVAVVALLKGISSRKNLETLIEGESLLNDGTAIVCFTIFLTLVNSSNVNLSMSYIVNEFLVVVCAGFCIGAIIGFIISFWWDRVFNDPMIEISVSIVAAFSAFLIAEHILHVSGVVAVVACAIVLAGYGRTKVSPEVSGFLHHFWGMMGFIAETIIFLIVGIVIGSRIGFPSANLWFLLLALYLIVMLVRATAILLFYPALKKLNNDFDKGYAAVLTWGGLRGVVGLTLALAAIQDSRIPKPVGDQLLFLTAGIVVLTIVINGSTMLPLIKFLNLDKLPIAKFLTVRRAKLQINEKLRAYYPEIKQQDLYKEAYWPTVESIAGIDDAINKEDLREEGAALLSVKEEDLATACKRRILEIERSSYWSQLNNGLLGNTATNILVASVDHALDMNPIISPRASIIRYWDRSQVIAKLMNAKWMKKLFWHYSFERFTISYELAKGFLAAQQEMLELLPTIAPDIKTRNSIIQEIDNNKDLTQKYINEMRITLPDILMQLETYVASRSMLYKKRKIIQRMVESGLLEPNETKIMISHVEQHMQALGKKIFRF